MNINGSIVDSFNVHNIVKRIFGGSEHSKRLQSIANAALGIISSGSLIIHRIGRGLASELNLSDKHAIKQVDRLMSNKKLCPEKSSSQWVPFVIGSRKEVKIAMDWTEFHSDNHATICLNLVTNHGRATPLIWKTVNKKNLKNKRNKYEDNILYRLRELVPENVKVTILADRGFCDIKLFDFLKELGFSYKIRIRGNILVSNQKGETRTAIQWVGESGRTKTIRSALVTHEEYQVGTVVCTQKKGMKEAWCIACSETEISGSQIVQWYSKRWGCEPQFRDTKDLHFGMGLSETHIRNTDRRDRLLLIHAIATALLTILGAAGENIGLDKYLKANTVKRRTLSLFSQGLIYFNRIPKMVDETLRALLTEFNKLLEENKNISNILGVI
jgi:hypothetical protein